LLLTTLPTTSGSTHPTRRGSTKTSASTHRLLQARSLQTTTPATTTHRLLHSTTTTYPTTYPTNWPNLLDIATPTTTTTTTHRLLHSTHKITRNWTTHL
jgi:hypothetical protein